MTLANAPLSARDARLNAPDLPDGTSGIFFARGLDRANQLDPLQQFRANEKQARRSMAGPLVRETGRMDASDSAGTKAS